MISANGGLPAHRYTPQVTQRWPRGSELASILQDPGPAKLRRRRPQPRASLPRRCRPDRPAGPPGHDRAPPAARQPTARGHALHALHALAAADAAANKPARITVQPASTTSSSSSASSTSSTSSSDPSLPAALILKAAAKAKAAAARTDPLTPTQATQAPRQRTRKTPHPTSAYSHLRTEILVNLEPDPNPKPDPKTKAGAQASTHNTTNATTQT